jgi:hypothetical protein
VLALFGLTRTITGIIPDEIDPLIMASIVEFDVKVKIDWVRFRLTVVPLRAVIEAFSVGKPVAEFEVGKAVWLPGPVVRLVKVPVKLSEDVEVVMVG